MRCMWAVHAVAPLVVAALIGCGTNQVTVEVRGGDGELVRLDAKDLEYNGNRLVAAGAFTYGDIKKGTYDVGVVAADHVERRVLEVDSAPISGTAEYSLTFDLPAGANKPFEPAGTIVFASTRTNVRNWDLFTVQADGEGLRQLTETREFEQHPSWSPDGKQIAYTRGDVMTNIDIWVMNDDGTKARRLTEHPERDSRAAWSPDGSQIAWVSQRDGDVAVWLMDADGGNPRKLAKGREPSWSPDGRCIAFVSAQLDGAENDELFLIAPDGTDLRRLTSDNRFDWFPAWSPAGDRLVFCSERFGGQELVVARADGQDQTRVTIAEGSYEGQPAWSPDGRGVAFDGKMTVGDDGEFVVHEITRRPIGDWEIYILPITGYDWDEMAERPVRPVNLTNSPDREDRSPSWRAY